MHGASMLTHCRLRSIYLALLATGSHDLFWSGLVAAQGKPDRGQRRPGGS